MFNVVQKKICMLGDFAVGKTSLMRRFVEDRFDDKYMSTIGVKISRKTIFRPYGQLNLLLWDMTGGDDLGTQSRASYLRGASGAMVVCDLTRRETLTVLERYAHQMRTLNPQTTLVLIGNKMDMLASRTISDADLQAVCNSLGSETFFLTSAKIGTQVETAFLHLAEKLEAQT
jgi:small GTP-binding protein